MILKDKFYTVERLTTEGGNIHATLHLNARHRIFEGHFPGQPVVPGVCMVQMIRELLEAVTSKTLRLQQSDYIKFLSVIDPSKQKLIAADVRYIEKESGKLEVLASLHAEERICFKMKAVFIVV